MKEAAETAGKRRADLSKEAASLKVRIEEKEKAVLKYAEKAFINLSGRYTFWKRRTVFETEQERDGRKPRTDFRCGKKMQPP